MMSPCQIELFGQHMINNTTWSGTTRTTTNDCMWAKWGVAGGLLRVAALLTRLATLHHKLFFLYPALVEFKGMLKS